MTSKLKPCNCGGEAYVYSYEWHQGTRGYSVICKDCRSELGRCYDESPFESWHYGKYETEAEAIEAWNADND